MEMFFRPNIEKMKAQGDVQGLVKVLKSGRDAELRQGAVAALGEMRSEGAVEALVEVLKWDETMRIAIIEALGKIGGVRAVETLIQVMKGHNLQPEVRLRAAQTAGNFIDAAVVQALADVLNKDPLWAMRRAAARSLALIYRNAMGKPEAAARSKGAIPALIHAVNQPDVELLGILTEWMELAGVDPVSNQYEGVSREEYQRMLALYRVGKKDWEACAAMGAAAEGVMIDTLRDANPAYAAEAGRVLKKIGTSAATAPLAQALERAWKDPKQTDLGVAAVEALYAIGGDTALEALTARMYELPERAQPPAWHFIRLGEALIAGAVSSRDSRLVQPLLFLAIDRHWLNAVEALAVLGAADAAGPLYETLRDPRATLEQKQRTAIALGELGDARAADLLLPMLRDRNYDLKRGAENALVVLKDERVIEPLLAATRDPNYGHDAAARQALKNFGLAAVEPILEAGLAHDLQAEAVAILAGYGPQGIEALKKAVLNAGYRRMAVAALEKLQWQPDRSAEAAAFWVEKRQWLRCVEVGEPALDVLKEALAERPLRADAAAALDSLGWQPAADEFGAYYWAEKQQWERCLECGAGAVDLLVAYLKEACANKTDYEEIEKVAGISMTLARAGARQAVGPLLELYDITGHGLIWEHQRPFGKPKGFDVKKAGAIVHALDFMNSKVHPLGEERERIEEVLQEWDDLQKKWERWEESSKDYTERFPENW